VRYLSPLRYPGGKARLAPFFTRLVSGLARVQEQSGGPGGGGGRPPPPPPPRPPPRGAPAPPYAS